MIVDLKQVARHLGLLMLVLSGLILCVGLFSIVEHLAGWSLDRGEVPGFMVSALIGGILGGGLLLVGRRSRGIIAQREALLLVALSWVVGAAIAAMPFRLWSVWRHDAADATHIFDSYINCYFEATSGLTTTGATVVEKLATIPRGLLLWRAMTHWLGGLGIVVLFVAVLPLLGVGGRRVYKIEAPGPTPEGVTPRIQDTARILWLIYCGLTIAQTIALRLCGMSWFESVCHTMATLATGGFSTSDSSAAGFPSTITHMVLVLFMVLAGINFGLYHQLIRRQWRPVLRDPELRAYLLIIMVATVLVTFSLHRRPPDGSDYASLGITIRDALFQVVSIQTTTGFCSADFDQWGVIAKWTLVALMFVGASAGSTGGGIKVIRLLIVGRVLASELEHSYRRHVVRTVKVGRAAIDADLKVATLVYLLAVLIAFMLGAAALHVLEEPNGIDFTTAATASAATLNNIGPGLAKVVATQNYAWFSAPGKVVMTLLMLLGRLELFTILVLFSPRFWSRE